MLRVWKQTNNTFECDAVLHWRSFGLLRTHRLPSCMEAATRRCRQTQVRSTRLSKDANSVELQTTGSRKISASSSAPLGQRTFRELFLCAHRTTRFTQRKQFQGRQFQRNALPRAKTVSGKTNFATTGFHCRSGYQTPVLSHSTTEALSQIDTQHRESLANGLAKSNLAQ